MLTVYSWSVDTSILNDDDDDVLPTLAQGSFLFGMKLQRLWLGIAIQKKCVSLEVNPKLCLFGWISKFIIALKAIRQWTGQVQDVHNSRRNIKFHSKRPTTKNRNIFKKLFCCGIPIDLQTEMLRKCWLNRKHIFSPYRSHTLSTIINCRI